MAITDKSRKLLWARSGNRCALCRSELIMDGTPGSVGNESVVGDECHIISLRPGGPRYDPSFPATSGDEYSNLILLCKVHHKVVDDQHKDYTAERLRALKSQHETWVSKSLASENAEPKPVRIRSLSSPDYLIRITKGSELLAIVDGICASSFTHDELVSEDEVDLIGGFLETVQDWGDLVTELGAGQRVKIGFQLTKNIEELDERGFWVFASRETQILEGGVSSAPSGWPVAYLRVVRKTNEEIISVREQDGVPEDA